MKGNVSKVYRELKGIAKIWGCQCEFKTSKKAMGNIVIAGQCTGGHIDPKISIVYYSPDVTVVLFKHIFFHELGHHVYDMLRFRSRMLPQLEMERTVERMAYFLYKNYYPSECPHHAAFSAYRGEAVNDSFLVEAMLGLLNTCSK